MPLFLAADQPVSPIGVIPLGKIRFAARGFPTLFDALAGRSESHNSNSTNLPRNFAVPISFYCLSVVAPM